jgi:hypothetical protein
VDPDTGGPTSDDTGTGCPASTMAIGAVEFDTSISDGSPTNNYGAQELSNVGSGRLLLRFALPPAPATALAEGRVDRLDLVLTRVPEDSACAGTCPSAAGQIAAYPLRNDWVEGTNDGNDPGATWERRILTEDPWGMPGAEAAGEDRGTLAAVATIDATQPTVLLSLDPGSFDATWIVDGRISVIVQAQDSAVFVVATREHGTYAAPALELEFCP